jgi:transcription elongation GreA/GreB family factor
MHYAVPAVRILQVSGQATLAVDYAYRVLRSHFSDVEAHKAYIGSLMPTAHPPDIPIEMDLVEVGSAVLYSEGTSAPVSWFVIENTVNPNADFEEITWDSFIARELLGKRVGETFTLAKSSIKDRVGSIHKILSKYTRRFQDCMNKMQIRFGEASPVQSVEIGPSEGLIQADIQPLLDSLRLRAEQVASFRTAYKDLPMSLHMYGARFGQNGFGAVMDLATAESESIKCADGRPEILQRALGTLQTKSTIVVELSALGTLRLLRIENELLRTEGIRFVMSQDTAAELQQLRIEARTKGKSKTMFFENGRYYFAESTEEQAEHRETCVCFTGTSSRRSRSRETQGIGRDLWAIRR